MGYFWAIGRIGVFYNVLGFSVPLGCLSGSSRSFEMSFRYFYRYFPALGGYLVGSFGIFYVFQVFSSLLGSFWAIGFFGGILWCFGAFCTFGVPFGFVLGHLVEGGCPPLIFESI